MKGKRQWLGRRVWVVDAADGTRRNGTLWFTNESNVLIREEAICFLGVPHVPHAADEERRLKP
jgi:hypothetical protein